eukprot:1160698-Pelagomonas_calceolata.AAC.1
MHAGLAVVLVGRRADSLLYVSRKQEAAHRVRVQRIGRWGIHSAIPHGALLDSKQPLLASVKFYRADERCFMPTKLDPHLFAHISLSAPLAVTYAKKSLAQNMPPVGAPTQVTPNVFKHSLKPEAKCVQTQPRHGLRACMEQIQRALVSSIAFQWSASSYYQYCLPVVSKLLTRVFWTQIQQADP